MRDFTLTAYRELLFALQRVGYQSVRFADFCAGERPKRLVILRHDVDLKAENSLETAKIEHDLGMQASYYFRVVPESNQPEIIRAIAALGHEIGYHYEDVSLFRGDLQKSIRHFEEKLDYFRQFYPVKTACMHGSPTSKWDNRILWKTYDYHDFGIIGEPYFDVDFTQFLYLTDTGRCWNGERFSIRDKVDGAFRFNFKHTSEIVKALDSNQLPNKLMLTTHPQRWADDWLAWNKEWVGQTVKNQVKRLLNKKTQKIQ